MSVDQIQLRGVDSYPFDSDMRDNESLKNKRECNYYFLNYMCVTIIIFSIVLLLASSIYTNVMLQMFLLKLRDETINFDFEQLVGLYYNVSHNTYVMCVTNPLIKDRDTRCHLG